MKRLSQFSRSIKGKIVLVTGAASGMGRATAELFSDEGALVMVTDLDKESIDNVVTKIKNNGNQAEGFVLDVSKKSITQAHKLDKKIYEIVKFVNKNILNRISKKIKYYYEKSDSNISRIRKPR